MLASPVHFVSKDSPPFLMEHVVGDPVVPLAQSEEMVAALQKVGVEATLHQIPGEGHGEGMLNGPGWQDTLSAFFDKHLKNKR